MGAEVSTSIASASFCGDSGEPATNQEPTWKIGGDKVGKPSGLLKEWLECYFMGDCAEKLTELGFGELKTVLRLKTNTLEQRLKQVSSEAVTQEQLKARIEDAQAQLKLGEPTPCVINPAQQTLAVTREPNGALVSRVMVMNPNEQAVRPCHPRVQHSTQAQVTWLA
eukprot:SAG11_NODE_6787_length_1249_cov_0.824348_1_plen_167_part_00